MHVQEGQCHTVVGSPLATPSSTSLLSLSLYYLFLKVASRLALSLVSVSLEAIVNARKRADNNVGHVKSTPTCT